MRFAVCRVVVEEEEEEEEEEEVEVDGVWSTAAADMFASRCQKALVFDDSDEI